MQTFARAAIYLIFLIFLVGVAENARAVVKSCPIIEVPSVKESAQIVRDEPLATRQAANETHAGSENEIAVVARGQILGSMDSRKPTTGLTCTNDGLAVTATITRSANYRGAVRQNVLWVPTLSMVITPAAPRRRRPRNLENASDRGTRTAAGTHRTLSGTNISNYDYTHGLLPRNVDGCHWFRTAAALNSDAP